MQQISDMKRVIREQHDYHFQLFTVAKNIEEAKEKWKQRLKEKIGDGEAEKLFKAIEEDKRPNKKWTEPQEAIKQKYRK